jgi:hypothetical protein
VIKVSARNQPFDALIAPETMNCQPVKSCRSKRDKVAAERAEIVFPKSGLLKTVRAMCEG